MKTTPNSQSKSQPSILLEGSTPPPPKFRPRYQVGGTLVPQIDGSFEFVPVDNPHSEQLLEKVDGLEERARRILKNMAATEGSEFPLSVLREEREFAADFYACYTEASGVLSNALGADLVLQTFLALKPYFVPITGLDYNPEWKELPESFPVYRGGAAPAEELVRGISWSRSIDVARAFADTDGALVVRAQAHKKDLLAYFTLDQECILQPSRLEGWTAVEEVSLAE